ncbi:hypothetical protein vBKpnAMK6_00116 [Klebsiella phage vB_Kpn_AM_K6]
MTDRLIRELLVDIKQRGGSKAAKQIRDVEAALDGATQSSEGLNQSLGKLPATFTSVERSVSRTQKSLEKLASTTSLTTLASSIGMLSGKFTTFEADLAKSVLKSLQGLKADPLVATGEHLSKAASGISVAVSSMGEEVNKLNKLLLELAVKADLASKSIANIAPGTKLSSLGTEIQKINTSLATAANTSVAEISKIKAALTSLISTTSTAAASMKTVGTGSGLSKLISEISTAAAASTSDISRVTASLKQLNTDAVAAGKALQSIKAGANLSAVPTVVGKIGTSMTQLRTQLEGSVTGIEKSLNDLSRAFATMGGTGNLNPLGNSIRGMVPSLTQLAKAAVQVNSALSKIQAGRGVLQLPAQFNAATASLNALETKLASTSQILERGFSKGFQDMASKSTSSSTRMINNFQKVVPELNAIEAAAIRSAAAIDKLIAKRIRLGQAGGGGNPAAFNMGALVAEMNRIVTSIEAMGNKMNTTMADMARSTDKVSDKLTDLNAGIRDVNTGLGGLNSTLTGTGSAANRASRALGNTSGSARGATRNFAALAMVTGPMPLIYGAIASNVYVLKAAFDQLKLGDQLNRLEQFGSIVGAKTGTPIQSLAVALQEATGHAVSFEEAMRQASTAAAYGFDAKQISEFALVARRAAATLGVDMTDALNRVIKGVSKQEIELLDELGVTIRLNDAYAEYVKILNAANTGITYNIQGLTSFQKQQAYANAVVAESTKRFGYLDEVLRATPWEQFAANADSALRKVQQAAAKYLGPVIASINAAFYTSKASVSAEAATAQQESIKQMDGKDSNAVVMNLEASQKGLDEAVKAKEEVKNKLAALNKEIMDREAKMDMSTTLATAANYSGFGNLLTLGASKANKEFTQQTADMRRQAYMLQQELADSAGAIQKWKDARDSALSKAQKENPELAGKLNIAQNVEASNGLYTFDNAALDGAVEREIWKEQLDRNAKTAEMRKEEFERNQSMKPLMGESQKMQEQLAFYQEMKEFTKGNADEQARWSKEIANTTAQMAALKSQRNAQMMDRVGQSVGADYTPTTGLEGEDKKFADMENQMASYDTAISKLSQLNSEATATAQSMGNLANAMIQFSQGSLDTTSMIAAGMQTVSQMISYGTNQQISAIDAAIAAEQKRDGKSEQSKNKIKKMEAEKIKLQQESAKKQIIIQTAVAVMQAATAVPYPFSIPLMIAAGLAGALSLAQASSATGMTDIAGSGGDTASYLTLGERQKNVDVSMGASSGELSYVRGDKGIGSANGFIPRAEGGNTYPGVSYKMGEHGTEVATPMVPTKVTPSDEVASGTSSGSTGRPVQLNIQAMDAKSFMEYALENPAAFQAAVELALNEQGLSLKNLN